MIDGMLTSDNEQSPIEWEDLPDTCPVCDSENVVSVDDGDWVCEDCGVEWNENDEGEGDLDEF